MTTLALLACFLALPVGILIGWNARARALQREEPSFFCDLDNYSNN